MFLSKILIYGAFIGTVFSISTFSSMQISKAVTTHRNNNEANTTIEEEEEEEELPQVFISDTDRFISALSSFGNMRGNLDLDLNYQDYHLNVNGDVFVSMESLDNLALDADLIITTDIIDPFNVKATYLENNLYVSINDKNLKLSTSNISDLTSLIDIETNANISFINKLLENFSLDDLLTNLANMEAVKEEEKITYTCNLIPFMPPIIFTSDLNYKMTSISLDNLSLLGIKGYIHASTEILGRGKSEITNPELDSDYVDVSHYFGIISQVQELIKNQSFNVSYKLDAYKSNNPLISTTGEASIDIKNLNVGINGELILDEYQKDYEAYYQNDTIYFSYGEVTKLSYQKESLLNLIDVISNNIPTDVITNFMEGMDVSLPLIDAIKSEDYLSLLDYYQDVDINDNYIEIHLNNGLIGLNGTSSIRINLDDEIGITNVIVNNLNYNEYQFNLSLDLNEYHEINIDNKEEYHPLDNLKDVISNTIKIKDETQFGAAILVKINDENNNELNASIDANVDLNEIKGGVEINVNDFNSTDHLLDLDFDKEFIYASYNNEINAKIGLINLNDIYSTTIKFINNNLDSIPNELIESITNEVNNVINSASNFDYLSIIKNDYIKYFDYQSSNFEIILNKDIFNIDKDIHILINSVNDTINSINVATKIKGYEFEINIALNQYLDKEYIANKEECVDFSSISEMIKYLLNNDNNHSLNLFEQISSLINTKQIGLNYSLDITKNNATYIATNGNANIDLNNDLLLDVSGNINVLNKEDSIPYNVNIFNNNIYLNYKDLIKVSYDLNNANDLMTSINSLINNEDIAKLLEGIHNISLPVIDDINSNNYQSLINKFDGIEVDGDSIIFNISNSLLTNENSDFQLTFNFDENGLSALNINNLIYNEYELNLMLEISNYEHEEIITTDYISINQIDKLIDQINSYLNNKQIAANLDVNINGLNINGNIQLDLNTLDLDANILIKYLEDNYHIEVEYDDNNLYLIYNDKTYVNMSKESISNVIKDIINLLKNESSPLVNPINELKGQFDLSSITKIKNKDIVEIIFDNYLSNFSKDEEGNLSLTINKDMLNLNNDIEVTILLNEGNIKGIKFNYEDISAQLDLLDYSDRTIKAPTNWNNISSVSNVIHYITNLDDDSINGVINQVQNIIENKKFATSYSVNVSRDNSLVFDINGDIDLDLLSSDINNYQIGFKGLMTNQDKALNSNVSIYLNNGVIYFNYNNQLKLSYSIDNINDLISIIKNRFGTSLNIDSSILSKLLPDGSTLDSPLFNVIKNKNYLDLINYYQSAEIINNELYLHFDSGILGETTGTLTIKLNVNDMGINSININNLYAFGYILNIELNLREYEVNNTIVDDINSYTPMNYINNLIDNIYELTTKNKFDIALSGTVNLGNGKLSIDGNSYFELGDLLDVGVANLTIKDTSNKPHNVIIDVNRKKVNDTATEQKKLDALKSSNVYFVYNSYLKGKFNLESLSNSYNLISSLAQNNDPRFEKWKAILTADFTESTLMRILGGDIEAILYTNFLNSVNYNNVNKTYDIVIDGNLLKPNDDINIEPILLTIAMNEDYSFKSIRINGNFMGVKLDITAAIKEATTNNLGRLSTADPYYDFSEIDILLDYLLNTAKCDDFTLSGSVKVSVPIVKDINLGLSALVHINEDESVVGKVVIDNIPHYAILSDGDWDYRRLTIYLTDDEVYLNIYQYDDYLNWFKTYRKTKETSIRLTLNQFLNDIAYYLVNYGLGIKTSVYDLRDTSGSDNEIILSKLLTKYTFNNSTNPSWNVGINMEELTGTSMIDDLDVTISGNKSNKLLSTLKVNTSLLNVIDANINASLTSTNYIGDSALNSINSYISNRHNDKLGSTVTLLSTDVKK